MAETAVALERVAQSDAALLANLLELYIHDLSEHFAVELGPDGRFGYRDLPSYWEQPDERSAYFIRAAQRRVGFALVRRGSPLSDDPAILDVAEFFVLRRFRRTGIGRLAALQLFGALRGAWSVRVLEQNERALAFWRSAIADHAGERHVEAAVERSGARWRHFTFASP